MRFYADIAKVDAEQRMVWGYASTEAVDADGESILREAIAGALDDYMHFANIREMHQLSAVGVAKEAAVDDKGLYIGAKVVDDAAWNKVVEGVYKGFSIGGKALARDPANRSIITQLRLTEISLVDRPCNPEAVFDCWKADSKGAVPLPNKEKAAEAAALVAAFLNGDEIPLDVTKGAPVDGKGVSPPVSGKPVEEVRPTEAGETAVERPVDGDKVDLPTEEVPEVKPEASGDEVVEKPVDGKRPAALIPEGDGDPVQVVNPDGEKVEIDGDLSKIDESGQDDPIVKRKFTVAERREAAKSGAAMKDGSFPIENKEDLENAIRAIGRAKDRDAAVRHIKRRAKALGLEDMLPEDMGGPKKESKKAEKHVPEQVWTCGDPSHNHLAKAEAVRCIDQQEALAKAAAAAKPAADAVAQLRASLEGALAVAGKEIAKAEEAKDVKKGLYTLSDLACMLLQLRAMINNVDYEETGEGDANSRMPQLMRDALRALVEAFRAMSEEETAELLESVATNTAEPQSSATFLYLAAHADDILKAGARHSKADRDRIQKAHDILTDLGAVCMTDDDDDYGKVAKALSEKDAELAELKKVLDQVAPLTKAVTELGETITDLRKTVTDQAAEIEVLKAQPMPPKTAANGHAVTAVEKTGDGGSLTLADDDTMLAKLAEMSDEERAFLLVKAARRAPRGVDFR